jgi:ATP-binding cassette subfamily B protein
MLRLLDPDQGRITLDGQDLRGFTVESVRRATSLGTQENSLFSGTIADNIRIGRPGASDAEVAEAARVACLDSLVSALPEGFQTPVGGRALELSTGQRQRLVIARALLKATPILVLDEPTASLDPATERTLVDNLKAWAKDRTLVIITHRMSTAACADQVVILDAGRVVESGRPDDLARAGGAYSRLLSLAGREDAA